MGLLWHRLARLWRGEPERRRDLAERARREAALEEERRKRLAVRREDVKPPPVAF